MEKPKLIGSTLDKATAALIRQNFHNNVLLLELQNKLHSLGIRVEEFDVDNFYRVTTNILSKSDSRYWIQRAEMLLDTDAFVSNFTGVPKEKFLDIVRLYQVSSELLQWDHLTT